MGDLKGHMAPGSLFLIYGLWWAVCALRRYFLSRRANQAYRATIAFSCPCACGRLTSFPVESVAKVVLAGIGMLGELVLNLPHPSMGIVQHATMYFFFLLSGCVDLAMHFGVPIPPGADFLAVLLAFAVEGLLFANHLHGRDDLDTHLHVLLCYVIFATVLVIALEVKFQRSILLTLSRAFLTMFQGTWFCAVGIILYGHDPKTSPWAKRNHEDVMKSTLYFSWHAAVLFLVLLFLTIAMSCFFRDLYGKDGSSRRSGGAGNGDISLGKLDGRNGNGYRVLTARDEEEGESDIEFEKPVEKVTLLP